jgi:pimeloyl-ACP methyl ester carboxylesterase
VSKAPYHSYSSTDGQEAFSKSQNSYLCSRTKDGPAFHVVAPSLANFGFSSRVDKKGFSIAQHAEAVHKIMLALGYEEYVTQAGDWGFLITRALGHLYPAHVKAIHTNWVGAPFPSALTSPLLFGTSILKFAGAVPGLKSVLAYIPGATYTAREIESFASAKDWWEGSGRGYFAILGTKPQTMAYSLADSPSGLLGFIWEKLKAWSDDYPWTDDEILAWISITIVAV